MADELVVLNGAKVDHDGRTGRPVLELMFAETSKETLRTISDNNLGQKVEFRVAGRVLLTSVLREPMASGAWQISDPSWTDQVVIDLATQLNNSPKREIEIRTVQGPR